MKSEKLCTVVSTQGLGETDGPQKGEDSFWYPELQGTGHLMGSCPARSQHPEELGKGQNSDSYGGHGPWRDQTATGLEVPSLLPSFSGGRSAGEVLVPWLSICPANWRDPGEPRRHREPEDAVLFSLLCPDPVSDCFFFFFSAQTLIIILAISAATSSIYLNPISWDYFWDSRPHKNAPSHILIWD